MWLSSIRPPQLSNLCLETWLFAQITVFVLFYCLNHQSLSWKFRFWRENKDKNTLLTPPSFTSQLPFTKPPSMQIILLQHHAVLPLLQRAWGSNWSRLSGYNKWCAALTGQKQRMEMNTGPGCIIDSPAGTVIVIYTPLQALSFISREQNSIVDMWPPRSLVFSLRSMYHEELCLFSV